MVSSSDNLTNRRRDANRTRILDSAAERLAEHGYGATSLADVALLAQVDPAVVSFHFPTVEDLVEAVLRAGIDHARSTIDEALAAAPSADTGAERLAIAMNAYLRAISERQHVTRANIRCYRSVPPVVRRGLAVHMREFVETWSELLEAGRADNSLHRELQPGLVARVLIAALNSTVTADPSEIDTTADQLRLVILEGIRA